VSPVEVGAGAGETKITTETLYTHSIPVGRISVSLISVGRLP
jgi:hypothetical protein